MKRTDFFMLLGAIYIAPHVTPFLAIALGMVMLVLGIVIGLVEK